MATVFDVFREDSYTYLTISRGKVFGNRIVNTQTLQGIIKIRNGMTRNGNVELYGGDLAVDKPTIHAHPEDFSSVDAIIGNGVEYNGKTYDIVGVTEGKNFDDGKVGHLTLTLKEVKYASA